MLLLFSLVSYAFIGENVANVQDARRVELSGNSAYRVLVSTYESGELREFFGQENIIFAVCWEGKHHYELQQILGEYNDPGLVPHRSVKRGVGDDLVLELTGRMHHVRGKAYVPSLLPPGVSHVDF